ncbi:unnamed protein product [Strongylus vulgaris]|uniref:Uncharacterized protein n=1 Tax=Strongylus vulgaris TaxID=40348 RepID=A0A3P7JKJ6_STRVU|nr:unnamed protein product [Strongylus vulgaris]
MIERRFALEKNIRQRPAAFASAHPPILLLLLLRVLLLTYRTVECGPTDRVVLGESVDLIVSHGRQTEQRLFGSFSPAGLNYEVQGDVVQVREIIFSNYPNPPTLFQLFQKWKI